MNFVKLSKFNLVIIGYFRVLHIGHNSTQVFNKTNLTHYSEHRAPRNADAVECAHE